MSNELFFSDRLHGVPEPSSDVLSEPTRRGLLGLVDAKIKADWFALSFPRPCPDGEGVVGTDTPALERNLLALVPTAPWPLWDGASSIADETVFDVIEYAVNRVAVPFNGAWHSFFRHNELRFDRDAGRDGFRAEINQMLQRGGVMYRMNDSGQVERLGTAEVQSVRRALHPAPGDHMLDSLIEDARTNYASHEAKTRSLALERLWDAFERLKTLEIPGGDKKASAEALLDRIAEPALRDLVRFEMDALTKIGNNFSLRHFETRTTPIPDDAQDYFFVRMGSLITYLLHVSGRLGTQQPDSLTPDW